MRVFKNLAGPRVWPLLHVCFTLLCAACSPCLLPLAANTPIWTGYFRRSFVALVFTAYTPDCTIFQEAQVGSQSTY